MSLELSTIKKKPSEEQKIILIQFLEGNLALARNQLIGIDGRHNSIKKWEEVAGILNAMGRATKSGQLWKKYWEDLRIRVKTKYSKIKEFRSASGINGVGPQELSPSEERVMAIVSIQTVEGDTETPELCDNEVREYQPHNRVETVESEHVQQATPQAKKRNTSGGELTSEESKYLDECLSLKKKKLQLYENFEKRNIELREEEIQIRYREVVAREKELELKERELKIRERVFQTLQGEYLD